MDEILFNPFKPDYKTTIGAIRSDELVTFTVKITKKYNVYQLRLIIKNDNNECIISKPFDCYEYGFDDSYFYNIYKVDIENLNAGLYWYYFEFDDVYGTHYIASSYYLDAILTDYAPLAWQLSVYDQFKGQLDWFKGKVMYQIMVDRFYCKELCDTNVYHHKSWDEMPIYNPLNGRYCYDFFGGNLQGIIEKLDYLKTLNVGVIYLNPIFEAFSNHKYDTANYMKIDPSFGTEKDFVDLIEQAKKRGIHIILDGVFNHTGDDSIYFNKYGKYDNLGAFQSKESPYFSWYEFKKYPNDYESWWGFKTLPSLNQNSKDYVEYITGVNGVIDKWLSLGASGFRLDVVDELYNPFVQKISLATKRVSPEKMLIGEVWEDASHKIAYSERKEYFNGHEIDSVMNYPFKEAVIDFLKNNNYRQLQVTIRNIINNYPKHVVDCLMNFLGTHDTVRILNAFTNIDYRKMSRDEMAVYSMSDDERKNAITKVKMASGLIFTLPGVPSIFYGDEAGLEGLLDPFCRRTYPWGKENQDLINWYKRLGNVRKDPIFIDGLYQEEYIESGIFSFSRVKGQEKILIICNNSHDEYHCEIASAFDLMTEKNCQGEIIVFPQQIAIYKLKK